MDIDPCFSLVPSCEDAKGKKPDFTTIFKKVNKKAFQIMKWYSENWGGY